MSSKFAVERLVAWMVPRGSSLPGLFDSSQDGPCTPGKAGMIKFVSIKIDLVRSLVEVLCVGSIIDHRPRGSLHRECDLLGEC